MKQLPSGIVNYDKDECTATDTNCPCFGGFQHQECLNFCNSLNSGDQQALFSCRWTACLVSKARSNGAALLSAGACRFGFDGF
jgi:hypothetical protein